MDEFVVGPSSRAIARNREFWGGRAGLALMTAPGVIMVVVGVVLTGLFGQGNNLFFGIVIVVGGLVALWSGWATHVRDRDRAAEAVWMFRLDREGVHFPRHHPTAWADVRFVLTDGTQPQLLVSPIGYAFALDRLDRTPDELGAAISELSGGAKGLERG
ncbi:hypothetical protein [Mariniluteicoccus flavus]